MPEDINFKKMYLISAQKWQELSQKINSISTKNPRKSDLDLINDNKNKDDMDHDDQFENNLESSTNIRVDQSKSTKVKNISIGIKNSNPLEEQPTEKKTGRIGDKCLIQDGVNMLDNFVSCDCEKDKKQNGDTVTEQINIHSTKTIPKGQKIIIKKTPRTRILNSSNQKSHDTIENISLTPENINTGITGNVSNAKFNSVTDEIQHRDNVIKEPNLLSKEGNPVLNEQITVSNKRKRSVDTDDGEKSLTKKRKKCMQTAQCIEKGKEKEGSSKEKNKIKKKLNNQVLDINPASKTIKKSNLKQNLQLRLPNSFRLKRSITIPKDVRKWVSI